MSFTLNRECLIVPRTRMRVNWILRVRGGCGSAAREHERLEKLERIGTEVEWEKHVRIGVQVLGLAVWPLFLIIAGMASGTCSVKHLVLRNCLDSSALLVVAAGAACCCCLLSCLLMLMWQHVKVGLHTSPRALMPSRSLGTSPATEVKRLKD